MSVGLPHELVFAARLLREEPGLHAAPALAALHAPIATGVKRRAVAGKSVVGFQIAFATLLLISAGLFIRSLDGLTAVNPGFHTDHLLLAQIVLPQNRYPAGANVAFHQRMEQAIAEIPGVAAVAGAEAPYLSGERLETRSWRRATSLMPVRIKRSLTTPSAFTCSTRSESQSSPDEGSPLTTLTPHPKSRSSTSVSPPRGFPIRIR